MTPTAASTFAATPGRRRPSAAAGNSEQTASVRPPSAPVPRRRGGQGRHHLNPAPSDSSWHPGQRRVDRHPSSVVGGGARSVSAPDARPVVGTGRAIAGGDDDDLSDLEVQRQKLQGLAKVSASAPLRSRPRPAS